MPAKYWINFAGMLVVHTDVASVAGDFCSHIGMVSQAEPAAFSQVARQHYYENQAYSVAY